MFVYDVGPCLLHPIDFQLTTHIFVMTFASLLTPRSPGPYSGSYERRVRDVQSWVKKLRFIADGIQERLTAIEDCQCALSHSISTRISAIDSAEADALRYVADLYSKERAALQEAFQPMEDSAVELEAGLAQVDSVLEFATSVCSDRRSVALVDIHDGLIKRISEVCDAVGPLLLKKDEGVRATHSLASLGPVPDLVPGTKTCGRSLGDEELWLHGLDKELTDPLDQSDTSESYDATSRVTLSSLKVLDEDEYETTDQSIKIYLDTGIDMGRFSPFYVATIHYPQATISDLLNAVRAQLNCQAGFHATLRISSEGIEQSPTYLPLSLDSELLKELNNFSGFFKDGVKLLVGSTPEGTKVYRGS